MTNEDALRDAGLTDEEIEEMKLDGFLFAQELDVVAGLNIASKYYDVGLDEQAERVENLAYESSSFLSSYVQELTGKTIEFDISAFRWRDTDNGQFVKEPYTQWNVEDSTYNQWIIDTYS